MNPRDVFERFRSERRAQAFPGFSVEVLAHLSRHTATVRGIEGFVLFAEMDAAHAGGLIDEQVKYFADRREAFEWKVYDFDSPDTLKRLLEARGFEAEESEAFLVLPTDNWPASAHAPASVTIEKLTAESQLSAYVAAEELIWSNPLPDHLPKYREQLRNAADSSSIYCAYVDGKPVATGRINFPPGSEFAELYGGGVLPEWRGRGLFTAMLSCRIAEAKARGCRLIAVDAAPMSRPILLRKGFMHVCWTYPMRRKPDGH
jgi:GNAT superfamily N-acetyltransferase